MPQSGRGRPDVGTPHGGAEGSQWRHSGAAAPGEYWTTCAPHPLLPPLLPYHPLPSARLLVHSYPPIPYNSCVPGEARHVPNDAPQSNAKQGSTR